MVRLSRAERRTTFIRLSSQTRRLPALFTPAFLAGLGADDLLFVDGAEQLSWYNWLRFRFLTRHAGGVIVTTLHKGRFPVLHRCMTSPELLHDLVLSLGTELTADEAQRLHRSHGGNIRHALRELHDRYAEKDDPELFRNNSLV